MDSDIMTMTGIEFMTQGILELAEMEPKGDWQTYEIFKEMYNKLPEHYKRTPEQYEKFIVDLARILEL
jgi:hypothetical protein